MRIIRILFLIVFQIFLIAGYNSVFANTKGTDWDNKVEGNQYINYYGLSQESIRIIDSNNDKMLTRTEVRKFQAKYGLTADGKFGDVTANKLNEIQNNSAFTASAAPELAPLIAGSITTTAVTSVVVGSPEPVSVAAKKAPDISTENILGIQNNDLRNGNVDMSTIPKVIVNIINILLGVVGTISIVSLIYYSIQMQINSGITGDSSGVDKAKKGMYGSIIGFIVAILAWFIVIRFIEILSTVS